MTAPDGSLVLEDRTQAPVDVGPLRADGVAACRQRRFEAAVLAFAAWTTAEPTSPAAWLSLARAQFLAGLPGDARQSCDECLKLDAAQLRGHLLLARIAAASGDGKLRVAAMKEAVALRPAAVAMRLMLVRLMLRRIQHKAAMTVAKEALVLAPENPHAMLAVARCHVALGHLVDADALLDRVGKATAGTDGAIELERDRLLQDLAVRRMRAADAADSRTADGDASERPARPVPPGGKPPRVALAAVALAGPAPVVPRTGPQPAGDVEGLVTPAILRSIDRARRGPGLVDHLLIVRALILRDIRLHHRNNVFGVLIELVRPAVVVFVHYWLFVLLHKPMPAEIPIEIFVLAGFTVWFAFNATWLGASTGGRWPAGATSLPGVTELHMRVARAAWGLLLNLVFCLVAVIPLGLVDRGLPLASVPETCAVFAIAGLSGFGLGLILERLGRLFSFVKTVEKLLTWAIFVTSGLYFSVETTPPQVAYYFLWNPMLHLVEYERNAFDPGYPIALLDLRYPACVMVFLLITGLLVYGGVRCPARD